MSTNETALPSSPATTSPEPAKAPPKNESPCCDASKKATCCAPAAKSSCCGPSGAGGPGCC